MSLLEIRPSCVDGSSVLTTGRRDGGGLVNVILAIEEMRLIGNAA